MLFLFLIFQFLTPEHLSASEEISRITIHGLNSMNKSEFLDIFGLREGDSIDMDLINKGIKRLFLKDIFNDIKVSSKNCERLPEDCTLLIKVDERDFIEHIKIKENKYIKDKDIKDLFELKEDMVYVEDIFNKAIENLKKLLSLRGFPHAEIKAEIERAKGPKRVNINLMVNEGEPLIIRHINLTGGNSFLKDLINIREGDVYDQETIKRKLKDIKKKLKKKGYFQPKIGSYSYDIKTGTLTIDVKTGKKLRVIFNDNKKIKDKRLMKTIPFFENEDIGSGAIKEASIRIISLYHAEGFIKAQVSSIVEERDNTVDIIFYIFEGESYKVSNIEFKDITLDADKLKKIIFLKEEGIFNPDVIEDEEDRIIEFYNALGFVHAEIESLKVDIDDDKKSTSIVIKIKEGEQLKITDIEIYGNKEISKNQIWTSFGISIGNPFDENSIYNGRQRVKTLYNQYGYIDSIVKVTKEEVPSGVILYIIIEEGQKHIFGNTIIKGNRRVRYKFFKRLLLHREGDPYNYNILLQEKRKLLRTGLFKMVRLTIIERDEVINDIIFEIKEGNHGSIEFGMGYGDYEGFKGFFDINYRNIMSMNRQIKFRIKSSEIDQEYSINFYDPWLFGKSLQFRSSVSYNFKKEKNIDTEEIRYKARKYAALSGIEKPLTTSLKAKFSYEMSFNETYDVKPDIILSREDTGTLFISGVVPALILDTRDNPFNPRNGFFGGLSLKMATFLLLSETDFLKLTGHMNLYKGLTKRFTAALSLRGGIAKGLRDTEDLPIIERYFLGGRSTVRGFPQDELGPKGSDGNPTGGNIFALGNFEMRIDVGKGFGLVAFLDTGNVWERRENVDFDELRYTSGFGLRYMTPVGPLRVDYGHKLDRKENESSGEIHFSLGHAF